MNFFDSHAHYNDDTFENNRDELIKKMYKDGNEIGSHTYSHLNLKNLSDYEKELYIRRFRLC